MAERAYRTFAEFWPFYLREHSLAKTRAFHYVGSTLALACLVLAIVQANPWWLLGMPLSGYFFAWVSHFGIERNRPATFTYPLWSLAADYKMYFLFLAGRLGPELRRAGVTGTAKALEA